MRRLSAIIDLAATTAFSVIPKDISTSFFAASNDNYLFHDCNGFQDDPSILPCLAPLPQRPAPEQWEAADLANPYSAPEFVQAIMSLTTCEEDAALIRRP